METGLKSKIVASRKRIKELEEALKLEKKRLETLVEVASGGLKKKTDRGLRYGSMAYMAHQVFEDEQGWRSVREIIKELPVRNTAKARRDLSKTLRAYADQGRYFQHEDGLFCAMGSPTDKRYALADDADEFDPYE